MNDAAIKAAARALLLRKEHTQGQVDAMQSVNSIDWGIAVKDARAAITAYEAAREPVEAVAAEREACARVVEGFMPVSQDMTSTMLCDYCELIATAIRAR